MKVVYVDAGWSQKQEFAGKVEQEINKQHQAGYEFHDIKISSNGDNTLLLFIQITERLF